MKLTPKEKADRKELREQIALARTEAYREKSKREQNPVKSLSITIEWSKSRTWGNNPHATAETTFTDGRFERRNGFTCSGCGYDKESTVIADIFNAFLAYKFFQPLPEQLPYGIATHKNDRASWYYERGVGTSCYPDITKAIGGAWEHVASGKTFDAYRVTF